MNWDAQHLLTLTIVALAALSLIRRLWNAVRGTTSSHCGSGCDSCGAGSLVSLDSPARAVDQPSR